jgi:hypothetical protein
VSTRRVFRAARCNAPDGPSAGSRASLRARGGSPRAPSTLSFFSWARGAAARACAGAVRQRAGRARERDRETERQRDRETERQRDRETERQRDRETERERERETERQRDRETERQRDRETERERERELTLTPLGEQVIQILHLESCADTVMGYQGERGGISGGERKRTGIAIELITNPSVQPRPRPCSGAQRCADAVAAVAGHLPGRAHLGTGYLHGALGLCDAQTGSRATSSRATPLHPAPLRCAPSRARAARR